MQNYLDESCGPESASDIINTLFSLKQEEKQLSSKLGDLKKQIHELSEQLIDQFVDDNLTSSSTKQAKAVMTETVIPTVYDWEAFYDYIKDNNAWYLLEKRATSTAWRELHNSGFTVPGTEPFTKYSINIKGI